MTKAKEQLNKDTSVIQPMLNKIAEYDEYIERIDRTLVVREEYNNKHGRKPDWNFIDIMQMQNDFRNARIGLWKSILLLGYDVPLPEYYKDPEEKLIKVLEKCDQVLED